MVFVFLIIIYNRMIDPTGAKLGISAGHSSSNEGGVGNKGHYLDISGRNMYHTVSQC